MADQCANCGDVAGSLAPNILRSCAESLALSCREDRFFSRFAAPVRATVYTGLLLLLLQIYSELRRAPMGSWDIELELTECGDVGGRIIYSRCIACFRLQIL